MRSARAASSLPDRTLAAALRSRANALNFLRLVLASAVIVWHAYPVAGVEPEWPAWWVGEWAVNGFFALSGYLITASRMRSPLRSYLWRRALRIYPGFWAVLLVTAFVLAPLSTAWTQHAYRLGDGIDYVLMNVTLKMREFGIGDTLAGVPKPDTWNASLWTLLPEFGAYLMAGLVLAVPLVRRRLRAVSIALLALLSISHGLGFGSDLPGILDQVAPFSRLWSFFAAGMVAYAFRDRIPVRAGTGTLAALLTVAPFLLGVQNWVSALPFALLLLWLGAVLPVRWGSRNDISYGIYVYAFPVQQLLQVSGVLSKTHPLVAALVALALTVPFAWASWLLVERPCIRLGARTRIPAGEVPALRQPAR